MGDGTRHADLDKLYADWGLLEDDLMALRGHFDIAQSQKVGILEFPLGQWLVIHL